MPEFDTYHILERYARDNSSIENRQAFLFLRRRTELSICWRALVAVDRAPISKLVELYLGVKGDKVKAKKLADMTEAERLDLFKSACTKTGIKLDPSLFKKK